MKVWFCTALLIVLAPAPARADTLYPGSNSGGFITRLGKGVKELGLDSMLVVGYDKTGDASALRASLLTGPTFRYFVIDNLSLAFNASFLLKHASAGDAAKQLDLGGMGTLSAGYYASLGGGMFIEPTIGVGGFYGRRTVGSDPSAVRTSIFGGTGTLGLAFAFYPYSRFSVRAGPQAVASFGRSTGEGAGAGFFSTDAGFGVGASYVF
jgi:hypothetical protein